MRDFMETPAHLELLKWVTGKDANQLTAMYSEEPVKLEIIYTRATYVA